MPAVAVIILQKAGRISELLEERVGVKGGSLKARLRRAEPYLPYEARAAGWRLVAAERLARGDGIAKVDAHRFDDDYRILLRHIQAIDPSRRRRGFSVRRFLLGLVTALASVGLLGVGLAFGGLL